MESSADLKIKVPTPSPYSPAEYERISNGYKKTLENKPMQIQKLKKSKKISMAVMVFLLCVAIGSILGWIFMPSLAWLFPVLGGLVAAFVAYAKVPAIDHEISGAEYEMRKARDWLAANPK